MRRLLLPMFVFAAATCTSLAGETKVVLLPADNISGNEGAAKKVEQLVNDALIRRGWKVVAPAEVESALETARVRYLDSLDSEIAASILASHAASGFVTTTIMTWRDGEKPIVALAARLVDENGATAWGDVVSISADDTEGLLGFGRVAAVEALSRKAVRDLFDTFPSRDGDSLVVRGRRKPLFIRAPRTYRSSALATEEKLRVCLLPFESVSDDRVAPRVVQEILALRLLSTGKFEIVEPAAFRSAMRTEKIRSFRGITPADMQRLAERVGTPLFLKGTIYSYREVPPGGSARPPELQLEMMLLDVRTERILWAAHHARRGDDYSGLFLRGACSTVVTLADRVLSELVAAGRNTKPRDLPEPLNER